MSNLSKVFLSFLSFSFSLPAIYPTVKFMIIIMSYDKLISIKIGFMKMYFLCTYTVILMRILSFFSPLFGWFSFIHIIRQISTTFLMMMKMGTWNSQQNSWLPRKTQQKKKNKITNSAKFAQKKTHHTHSIQTILRYLRCYF